MTSSTTQLKQFENSKTQSRPETYVKLSEKLIDKVYYNDNLLFENNYDNLLCENNYDNLISSLISKFSNDILIDKDGAFIDIKLFSQVATFGQMSKHNSELYFLIKGKLNKIF